MHLHQLLDLNTRPRPSRRWHQEFCILQIRFPDLVLPQPAPWPDLNTAEIRLFIDQGPASPAWRRVSSLRCGPRRRDRRVNCSIELAELVGQELPLVLKAAVAGVGGCQPGGDVKAGGRKFGTRYSPSPTSPSDGPMHRRGSLIRLSSSDTCCTGRCRWVRDAPRRRAGRSAAGGPTHVCPISGGR
jgi:hypothetical protein